MAHLDLLCSATFPCPLLPAFPFFHFPFLPEDLPRLGHSPPWLMKPGNEGSLRAEHMFNPLQTPRTKEALWLRGGRS